MQRNITNMIRSSRKIVPMIYAYTTPGVEYHDGYIKIGYTERDVDARIRQQTHTAGILAKKEWQGEATFQNSGENFRDVDFHAYLRKLGVKQPQDEGNEYFAKSDRNEWFHVSPEKSREHFLKFRENRGSVENSDYLKTVIAYKLRDEQLDAVTQTVNYYRTHENGKFLWNAKPRFGKTLSVYEFIKRIEAENVLIMTNRPAIANSWYSDYEKFIGRVGGYFFVSIVDALKDKPQVIKYEEYANDAKLCAENPKAKRMGLIEFVSLQGLKGSKYFGGDNDKLREVSKISWDVVIIDEAHEGVDTLKSEVVLDIIEPKFTLYLSGTPFKALADKKFPNDAIYNWTYADEQRKKHELESASENPYADMPKLNLFTYQMSEIIRDKASQGIEIDGETEKYAFDLNEFFATNSKGFVHDAEIDKFLNALTTQEKFPFSTPELRDELRHTLWLLDRVESARQLSKKLKSHPVFENYGIILAAGDGKIYDDDEKQKSYDKVVEAIREHEKTITLSVGQLTNGVTIPEWTGVLMLSNMRSSSEYIQAAFRAQNPCVFRNSGKREYYRKENAYVFDFDPARTLVIYEEFANKLISGRDDDDTRRANVRELLNFFPVIGEDDDGKMIELDAEKVLLIPRKIKSKEVVRRGFMSDFLFQNISNVFHSSEEIFEIIKQITPVSEYAARNFEIDFDKAREIPVDEDGNIKLDDENIIGLDKEIFGEKIYSEITIDKDPESIKKDFHENITQAIDIAKEYYGSGITKSDEKRLEKNLHENVARKIDKAFDTRNIQQQNTESEHERHKADQELLERLHEILPETTRELVETVETNKNERERDSFETSVRDHLRGFSRTIPSFLMAYGDDNVTLENFDKIIPDSVFREVTSISLEQFRHLRDDCKFFNPEVFDDSVREFMNLRRTLANYFEDGTTENIFDYIPPQKTNQIFTPKSIVNKMLDMLEQENPGCFDDPDKTFVDLYMKSGLYIAEIVKRLYRSRAMKNFSPNPTKRLQHIFAKQVYGLAPSEIIYRIATNFILGFDANGEKIPKHNFRQVNALEYVKDDTLARELDELFA